MGNSADVGGGLGSQPTYEELKLPVEGVAALGLEKFPAYL